MPPESFDAAWLTRREPVDHRSRAVELMPPLREAWRAREWSRVLDLGCGTGSNLRYLCARLPGPQHWTLVDNDPALLASANQTTRSADVHGITCVRGDLAHEGIEAIRHAHLVTGAALLDLVSDAWLERMVDACERAGTGALFTLTYDGGITWSPAEEDDELVRTTVNAHQRRDKGVGPALGPSAGARAERLFRDRGYRTWAQASPWVLGPRDDRLTGALVEGWERVALEWDEAEDATRRIRDWARRRQRTIASGAFRLLVGHVDVLALPAERA